jgi:biopolymer transport protein ExbD
MAIIDTVPTPALAGSAASLSRRTLPPRTRTSGPPSAAAEAPPISEINTTPLIDVMLVLLIMFIITIPMASHEVPLDLPRQTPVRLPPRPFHQLDIAANGALSWNGAPVEAGALPAHLAQLAADPGLPELRLNAASEARYERIDEVLAQIRSAGVQRLGFIGNERYGTAF